MPGRRGQFLLIAGSAFVAHAGVIALMLVSAKHVGPVVARFDEGWHISRSPTTRPRVTLIAIPPPTPIQDDALGERSGKGDSIATVSLLDVARAPRPHEFEQAWTRQQPTFAPPSAPPARQPSKPDPAQPAERPAQPPPGSGAKAIEQTTIPLPFGTIPTAKKSDRDAATRAEQMASPPAESPDPTADHEKAAQRSAEAAQPPQMIQPAGGASSPAPRGPSDLDAFAKEEGVDLTAGGITARSGREVRLVRPRVDLGFMADATAMYERGIGVTMRIETDATGKPRNVIVTKSSGSDVIDDAVRVAAFESYFGPPMSDRFAFTVRFLK